ncbi:MAG: hypothetical protein ACRDKX_07390, partial [Solirubrobacterales bacterium]
PALVCAPLPVLVAAAGLGACAFVFERADLVDVLGLEPRQNLDTAAVAIAACALVSIAAGRTLAALLVIGEERRLELTGPEAAEQAATLTLAPALGATLVGMLAAGAMIATDLHPAQELGFALAVGLLLDLTLVRGPLLAFGGRWIG